MPKSNDLQKVTMNLFQGDYAKLQGYYPDVGAAIIIRRVVRRYVEQIEAGGPTPVADISVDI